MFEAVTLPSASGVLPTYPGYGSEQVQTKLTDATDLFAFKNTLRSMDRRWNRLTTLK